MGNMSVNNARARFGSGGSRDAEEPVKPRLQPADPWDTQTGVQPVGDFSVDCVWVPVNDDWALVRTYINLYDGSYTLLKDAEVKRVYRDLKGERVEGIELVALAWTKKAISNGGARVLGMYERSPGHILVGGNDGAQRFRWYAQVGSRLSVAVVRLDGNLSGHARLVPVE